MQEHGPAGHWEMRHAQTSLATHQHSPHRHTQRHQTAHTDTPSGTNTTCAGTRLRGTRGVPTQGTTQQESDKRTQAHPDTTRVSLRESAATGHSRGCAWHPCHPPPLWPGTSLSAPLLPVLRASPRTPLLVSPALEASGSICLSPFVFLCLCFSLLPAFVSFYLFCLCLSVSLALCVHLPVAILSLALSASASLAPVSLCLS